jgi:mono/diheme cytochrome c family protein
MKKILFIMIIATMAACGTKLMLPADGEQRVQTESLKNGQEVFMEYCNRCHPAGNAGLGPSIINKPLPGFLMKFQVRQGLGVMPSFDSEHLSKQELDNLIAYIKELRKESK